MSNSSSSRARRALAAALCVVAPAGGIGAQQITAEDLGAVPISIAVPPSVTLLDDSQKGQLEAKLMQAATMAGLSGTGPQAGFVMTPTVTVTRELEAGQLRKMKVVALSLALAIRQTSQNISYAGTSLVLNGSGDTREIAITDAINSINPEDAKLAAFIEQGKRRIVQYYEGNCAVVRADARARSRTGNTEEAIALLMSVPREATTCHPAATGDAERLFADWQERECQSLVRAARADAANRDFEDAVEKLQRVDPSSSCARSADALIAEIDEKVQKSDDRSFQIKLRSMRVERETLTRSLQAPGKILERRKELTRETAVSFINKLPTRVHVPGRE